MTDPINGAKVLAWLCENNQPELAITVRSENARDAYESLGRKTTPLVSQFALIEREAALLARVAELEKVLKDVRWRVDDIRSDLMRERINGESMYGIDEWSTPAINLYRAAERIDAALSQQPAPGGRS